MALSGLMMANFNDLGKAFFKTWRLQQRVDMPNGVLLDPCETLAMGVSGEGCLERCIDPDSNDFDTDLSCHGQRARPLLSGGKRAVEEDAITAKARRGLLNPSGLSGALKAKDKVKRALRTERLKSLLQLLVRTLPRSSDIVFGHGVSRRQIQVAIWADVVRKMHFVQAICP